MLKYVFLLFAYWLCFALSSYSRVPYRDMVWVGKPWVVPAAIFRTIGVYVIAILLVVLEFFFGAAFYYFFGLPAFAWTILVFVAIWLFSMLQLAVFRVSHTYVLRQDGLEIRNGIVRLHSFVVTPSGFGDLLVYQSLGGRIFGYGEITVNSQGERQTKLVLVRSPFTVADTIRDIMGKPIVRLDSHT